MRKNADESAKHLVGLYTNLGDTSTDLRNNNLYSLLTRYVHGKTLLDIGCGAMHFMDTVKRKKGISVEGVEPNNDLVKLGKKIHGDIGHVYALEGEGLNGIKKKYDTVSMVDVLEHIEDDKNILMDIKERLTTDGRLLILVPAYQFLYSQRDKNLGHFRRYYSSQLIHLLDECGYKVEYKRYWNMLGFFTYFFFEKLLRKSAPHQLRTTNKKTSFSRFIHPIVNAWMKYGENNINLGFGLSLLVVAKSK